MKLNNYYCDDYELNKGNDDKYSNDDYELKLSLFWLFCSLVESEVVLVGVSRHFFFT